MRTEELIYRLDELKGAIIPIGFVGENEFTRVLFDSSDLFEKYPTAVASMTVKSPSGQIYPVVVPKVGIYVVWQVKASDLIQNGIGEVQLTFTVNTMILKTYTAKTSINDSLVGNGPTPDPIASFVEDANAAVAAVIAATEDIPATIDAALEAAKESGEFDGPQGEKGDKGDKGDQGIQGPKGDTGATGSQGPKGDKGDKGDTGATGAQGLQGIQGETGPAGADGKDGKDGKDGQDGAPGADGHDYVLTQQDKQEIAVITKNMVVVLLADVEETSTSAHAYAIGEPFAYNGILYKATAGYNWCIEKGTIKQNHTNRISQGKTSEHYGKIGRYLFIYPNTDDAYNRLISKYNIQIEEGTSATAFEPYSSDNTFYGGYIDPVAGEIVVEWAKYKCTGEEAITKWILYGSSQNIAAKIPLAICNGYYDDGAFNAKCNMEESVSNIQMYYGYRTHGICISNGGHVTIQVDGITSLNDMSAWLSENKPEIIFRLKTPIHIPIAPQDLQAFLDHNNFWSDANDITEVTYAVTESKDILATRKKAMDFDYAHHKKVQWNQLIVDGQFTDVSKWATNVNYGQVSVNNNIGTWTCTVTPDYYYRTGIMESREHLNIPETHKILMRATVRSSVAIRIALYALALGNEHSNPYYQDITVNEWTTIFGFVVQRNAGKFFGKGKICYSASSQNIGNIVPGTTLEAKDFMMFDLTQMFGAGNEPSTVEEFEHICEINGIDLTTYQPYDTGSDRWLIIP